ncbi:hypothetical protein [Saccharopolyspora mangrovi]|uniref:Uncharacterized protein n=1 Tax=Saccharopolyspora mangrovi TaxID=3082379 RepID=A0ABU6A7Y8_9PSEU|nr:hypothetical protein [Saccharopolyspora sp. S2-29]MEB3367606.1 hypothetical protein [Saccharopolyspora sp. S2-29]
MGDVVELSLDAVIQITFQLRTVMAEVAERGVPRVVHPTTG